MNIVRFGKFVLVLAPLLLPAAAPAHETDQYSIPSGRAFADLNGYFSEALCDVLGRSVATLNAQIKATLSDGKATPATAHFHAPEIVVRTVYRAMPLWVTWVEPLEGRLLSPEVRRRYPGLLTVYQPPTWIYAHPLLVIDPTKLPRLVRCGTLMVGGVPLGSDKMMHFAHMGYYYADAFYQARAAGKSVEDAMRAAVALGTGSNPFLSEATWLGLASTGVWSNADLATNYCGLLFFRNLTEAVRVQGVERAPMLVRDGLYWRLGEHVRRGANLFGPFVSDHWDEVLNPNIYAPGMGNFVRAEIHKRCDAVLASYVDRHLCPRTRAEWRALMEELTTYYGEDYGHRGDLAELINVTTVCEFPNDADDVGSCGLAPGVDSRDLLGRTRLWWAAADGDTDLCKALLAEGADASAADADGETPLHAAARNGYAEIVSVLLHAGADANAAALYGTTALHLAARAGHAETCAALVAAGADPDAQDDFGCPPLIDAVDSGRIEVAKLLVKSGATAASDQLDRTLLSKRARSRGFAKLADWLIEQEGGQP